MITTKYKFPIFFILLLTVVNIAATHNANASKKKLKKVILDAGHGGRDPGCRGVYSFEKDITLAVAKKVGKMIQDSLNEVKVAYTRDYDWYPELKERTNFANNQKGDLFISIHVNATPKKNSPVHGTLVLVCGPTRVGEKEVAIGEHAQNFDGNEELMDPNDPMTPIIIAQYSQAFLAQSVVVGAKMNDMFELQGRHTEGLRQQSLQVLASSAMPGVLVEIGYLNNVEEEHYLNSQDGQNEVANAIFQAIKFYKHESEKEPVRILGDN